MIKTLKPPISRGHNALNNNSGSHRLDVNHG